MQLLPSYRWVTTSICRAMLLSSYLAHSHFSPILCLILDRSLIVISRDTVRIHSLVMLISDWNMQVSNR
jgi:hypothetical protein